MKKLGAALIWIYLLHVACIDAQIRPVVSTVDGAIANRDGPTTPADLPLPTPDIPTTTPTHKLLAVAGNDQLVCVAGEGIVACKGLAANESWRPIPADDAEATTFTAIAVGATLDIAALGNSNGQARIWVGRELLTPLRTEGNLSPHALAAHGGGFIVVGAMNNGGGGIATFDNRGGWVEAQQELRPPTPRPLQHVCSDGQWVSVVGDGFWSGFVDQGFEGMVLNDTFHRVASLYDGHLLALGQDQLIVWSGAGQYAPLELPNANGNSGPWRALATSVPQSNNLTGFFLLGSRELFWSASPTNDPSSGTFYPVALDGLEAEETSELRDIWIGREHIVLVGDHLLATCVQDPASASEPPKLHCFAEHLDESPQPTHDCVITELREGSCLPFESLHRLLDERCLLEGRLLVAALPTGQCPDQEATFSDATGRCCREAGGCEILDAIPSNACVDLQQWMHEGGLACESRGKQLAGFSGVESCPNGGLTINAFDCC